MFKSILLPACEKFTNVRCQAVLGGCHRSAFKWHSLTPVACMSSDSVTGCGFFPQRLVILKHLYVFDAFFNKNIMTTSNFLWRYEEQEVVSCYLKYCLLPEQAQCEIKSTIWMQTWSAWSLAKEACELWYWKACLCGCGHIVNWERLQYLSGFVPYIIICWSFTLITCVEQSRQLKFQGLWVVWLRARIQISLKWPYSLMRNVQTVFLPSPAALTAPWSNMDGGSPSPSWVYHTSETMPGTFSLPSFSLSDPFHSFLNLQVCAENYPEKSLCPRCLVRNLDCHFALQQSPVQLCTGALILLAWFFNGAYLFLIFTQRGERLLYLQVWAKFNPNCNCQANDFLFFRFGTPPLWRCRLLSVEVRDCVFSKYFRLF